MKNFALILIVIGILTLIIPYVSFTKKDKVLEIGSLQVVTTEQKTIPVSPIVGAIMMAAGIVILVGTATRK